MDLSNIFEGIIIGVFAGLALSVILLAFRSLRHQCRRRKEKQDIIQIVKSSKKRVFEDAVDLAVKSENPVENVQALGVDAFLYTTKHLIKNKSTHLNESELRSLHRVLYWWKLADSMTFPTLTDKHHFIFHEIESVNWIKKSLGYSYPCSSNVFTEHSGSVTMNVPGA